MESENASALTEDLEACVTLDGPCVVPDLHSAYVMGLDLAMQIASIGDGIPEVLAVFAMAGDPDALEWLRVADVRDLKRVIDQLRRAGNVTGTKTMIVLGGQGHPEPPDLTSGGAGASPCRAASAIPLRTCWYVDMVKAGEEWPSA